MSIVAIVPIKGTSERVESKNFRPFVDGKCLSEVKISQMKNCHYFDNIIVSSESNVAKEIALSEGVEFIPRDTSFCNNQTPWSIVIGEVFRSCKVHDYEHVAWCHATSPFFDRFEEAIDIYLESLNHNHDSLFTVGPCNEFIISPDCTPVNYQWGRWHKYSQDLPTYFFVSGAFFIGRTEVLTDLSYVIGKSPKLLTTSKIEALDIDDQVDFEFAQYLASK